MSTVLISSIDRITVFPIYQSVSITNNQMFLTIDTSTWTEKMFYELPNIQFGIYTKVNGEYVKYLSENITVKTKVPESSTSPADAICYKIINIPNEFYLYIKPIFDNNAIEAHNAIIENGIEDGTIWTTPTDTFNIEIGYNLGDYVPVTNTITAVPPISFKADGTPLTAWSIIGNMQQTGTPTPTVPIMPQECGDATGQLIPYPFYSRDGEYSGVQFTTYNGRIVANGTLTSGLLYYLWRPEKFPAGTYTMSVKGKHSGAVIYFRDVTNGVTIASIQISQTGDRSVTFTVAEEISVMVYLNAGSGTVDYDCTIMLNAGSEALPFSPNVYVIPLTLVQTHNVYLSEPIRKIGEYADVASATGTSGVTARQIAKIIYTGEEDVTLQSINTYGIANFQMPTVTGRQNKNGDAVSTHFKLQLAGISSVRESGFYVNTINALYFRIESSLIDNADDFKAFLAQQYANGTPVCVWYVLATPTTETFTAPILTPATGSNTLTVDTTVQPSEVSITGTITQI